MTTLKSGPEVLQPIPQAEPRRTPLKRRASAPEPASLDLIYGNTDKRYEVGNRIRFELRSPIITVTATIVKVFTPFTMVAVMVVRIFAPSMDLEGDFVLKLYDVRCSHKLRNAYKVECWNRGRDMAVEKRRWSKSLVHFFYQIMADDDLYADIDDDDSEDGGENTDADPGEEVAQDETFFQVIRLKMYRSELEVYRQARQHGIDGIDVPRFISSVRVPRSYQSKSCLTQSASIKGTPGVFIQYVPGFPLQALCERGKDPIPRLHWKHIIDDGVRAVAYETANMNFFNMDCRPRNTVVHWDPIQQKWKCKLIDFGHCVIRKEGMGDWKWREQQASRLEESAIGIHMQLYLKSDKGFDYDFETSQYTQDLNDDFRRETFLTS